MTWQLGPPPVRHLFSLLCMEPASVRPRACSPHLSTRCRPCHDIIQVGLAPASSKSASLRHHPARPQIPHPGLDLPPRPRPRPRASSSAPASSLHLGPGLEPSSSAPASSFRHGSGLEPSSSTPASIFRLGPGLELPPRPRPLQVDTTRPTYRLAMGSGPTTERLRRLMGPGPTIGRLRRLMGPGPTTERLRQLSRLMGPGPTIG